MCEGRCLQHLPLAGLDRIRHPQLADDATTDVRAISAMVDVFDHLKGKQIDGLVGEIPRMCLRDVVARAGDDGDADVVRYLADSPNVTAEADARQVDECASTLEFEAAEFGRSQAPIGLYRVLSGDVRKLPEPARVLVCDRFSGNEREVTLLGHVEPREDRTEKVLMHQRDAKAPGVNGVPDSDDLAGVLHRRSPSEARLDVFGQRAHPSPHPFVELGAASALVETNEQDEVAFDLRSLVEEVADPVATDAPSTLASEDLVLRFHVRVRVHSADPVIHEGGAVAEDLDVRTGVPEERVGHERADVIRFVRLPGLAKSLQPLGELAFSHSPPPVPISVQT